jgi:nucleotide-binding universal stress UspA family protein
MIEPAQHGRHRRVLVALDVEAMEDAVLEEAARLAAIQRAELVGLFVEDAELLAAAALPMAAVISGQAGGSAMLDVAIMRRAFRVWSAAAERALAAAAERWQVKWSFEVARGHRVEQLLAQARRQDLLALTLRGEPVEARREGAAAWQVMRQARCSVLLVSRRSRRAPGVAVLYEGRDASLDAALRIAEADRRPLLVLALGEGEIEAAALRQRAVDWLDSKAASGRVAAVQRGDDATLRQILETNGTGLVILERDTRSSQDLDGLLDRVAASLLVLDSMP